MKLSLLKTKIKQIVLRPFFKMVKQSQIKDILLNVSTISSQVLTKNYKKRPRLLENHFLRFLKNPNRNHLNFFIKPTTVEEVNDLISDLKASKSIGPSSLPTKILS